MANQDNPVGFRCVRNCETHDYKRKAGGDAIAAGDAVILDAANDVMTSDGLTYATIAVATSGALLGVAATPAAADANNDVIFKVWDNPNAEFRGQCSGDPTAVAATINACDIEGTTGIMEVNEDAATEKVISITQLYDVPDNVAGTNAEVLFRIIRHQKGETPVAI